MNAAWKPTILWVNALLFTSWFAYAVYRLIVDNSGATVGIAVATFVSGAVALQVLRMAIKSTLGAEQRNE